MKNNPLRLCLLLIMLLPTLAFATSPCTNTEIKISNFTDVDVIIDSIIYEKGTLDLKTGPLKQGEIVTGTMDQTVDGTSRGFIALRFPDHSLYYIRYDYHLQKSGPWTCIKEIPAPSGSATANYQQALQGAERSGNDRTVYLIPNPVAN